MRHADQLTNIYKPVYMERGKSAKETLMTKDGQMIANPSHTKNVSMEQRRKEYVDQNTKTQMRRTSHILSANKNQPNF